VPFAGYDLTTFRFGPSRVSRSFAAFFFAAVFVLFDFAICTPPE
jgi:hypothetical protein